MAREEQVALSGPEIEQVRRIARRDGITVEEATTQLLQAGLARRVRRRTGKGPAKQYQFKKR